MKAALIPPISALNEFGHGEFHLLLSHLIKAYPEYTEHYKEERAHGAYLVLDNSAHEYGEGGNATKLMREALSIGAQEIVVPDVLEDSEQTIERAIDSIEEWYEGDVEECARDLCPAFQYVPQAKTPEEWGSCLQELADIHQYSSKKYGFRREFVVGVSKDYQVWDGGLLRLLHEYLFPLKETLHMQGVKVQVHLLGWGRELWYLKEISDFHTWIRSTDSAKPFVYALHEILLDPTGTPPEYPKRGDKYFQSTLTENMKAIAYINAKVFRDLAK